MRVGAFFGRGNSVDEVNVFLGTRGIDNYGDGSIFNGSGKI